MRSWIDVLAIVHLLLFPGVGRLFCGRRCFDLSRRVAGHESGHLGMNGRKQIAQRILLRFDRQEVNGLVAIADGILRFYSPEFDGKIDAAAFLQLADGRFQGFMDAGWKEKFSGAEGFFGLEIGSLEGAYQGAPNFTVGVFAGFDAGCLAKDNADFAHDALSANSVNGHFS